MRGHDQANGNKMEDGLMEWIMEVLGRIWRRLTGKSAEKTPSEPVIDSNRKKMAEQTASSRATPLAVVDEQANKYFDAIVKDIDRQKRRTFCYRARPAGFVGSDVLVNAENRFPVGARIVRSDGRAYEIYRVKKSKRRWVEPSRPTTGGGQ